MADLEELSDPKREAQLRGIPGAPMAPGSSEPFVGRDEAALLADPSIARLNVIPIGPPDIIVEE
jgi:hypothetical protein